MWAGVGNALPAHVPSPTFALLPPLLGTRSADPVGAALRVCVRVCDTVCVRVCLYVCVCVSRWTGGQVSRASCGWRHSACISWTGQVLVWGDGSGGRLGLGSGMTCDLLCAHVSITPPPPSQAHAYSTARTLVHRSVCNSCPCIRRAEVLFARTPAVVPTLPPARDIVCGYAHTLVVGQRGEVRGRGYKLCHAPCSAPDVTHTEMLHAPCLVSCSPRPHGAGVWLGLRQGRQAGPRGGDS